MDPTGDTANNLYRNVELYGGPLDGLPWTIPDNDKEVVARLIIERPLTPMGRDFLTTKLTLDIPDNARVAHYYDSDPRKKDRFIHKATVLL